MKHALSFDVEELYHAELVRRHIAPAERASQVAAATAPLLEMLARRSTRATFFVVGELLREHPDLVRAIAGAGHEIGCHSMSHRPLWDMTPDTLRAELREFRSLWQSVCGGAGCPPLLGFRAPTFSLVQRTRWALDVLAGEGFAYDSSIFPVANYMYGVSGGPLGVYRPSRDDLRRHDANGPLLELPMTAWQVGGLRLPVSGGFYLRLLPTAVLVHALREVARQRPVVIYAHPWEAFRDTPVVPGVSLSSRLITYANRSSVAPKLERLMSTFDFAPLCDVLQVTQ